MPGPARSARLSAIATSVVICALLAESACALRSQSCPGVAAVGTVNRVWTRSLGPSRRRKVDKADPARDHSVVARERSCPYPTRESRDRRKPPGALAAGGLLSPTAD